MSAGTPVVEANGARIPLVGLGTWTLRGRDCARLVEQAIRIGYRHIDTAQMYDNEREVGEGVRASGKRSTRGGPTRTSSTPTRTSRRCGSVTASARSVA